MGDRPAGFPNSARPRIRSGSGRSLLHLKTVLLNLASLAVVFGSISVFWQLGHGSGAIFNVSPTGAISFWLPVVIFSFLFELYLDYEVFILARMR